MQTCLFSIRTSGQPHSFYEKKSTGAPVVRPYGESLVGFGHGIGHVAGP